MLTLSEPTGITPTAPICEHDNFASGDRLLCVKGAPEVLLPRCTHVVDPAGGPPLPLATANKNRLVGVQERWAKLGRRVLVLARRVVPADALPKSVDPNSDAFEETMSALNGNLVVVGLVGLIDPLKSDIPETVR
jgi:sodium/potassium-transporting ATPase subunit alpha